MKICPKCKAQLEDHARFCLQCMTSLEEKEEIQPPAPKQRRWPLALLFSLLAIALATFAFWPSSPVETPAVETRPATIPSAVTTPTGNASTRTCTQDGVTYTFRSAAQEDCPDAIRLENYFVLIQVTGVPSNQTYQVPSFVGENTSALVVAVADGAFSDTQATAIDLGYNVRYVWGNAFGGNRLTALYLHEDVQIDPAAFSGCDDSLTIHCPAFLENMEGILWSELAGMLGFQWKESAL